jgi:hypothetical protein
MYEPAGKKETRRGFTTTLINSGVPIMKRFRSVRIYFCLTVLAALTQALPVRGEFDELLERLPASPNVLVVLNPEKIFASEVATEGGWKQQYGATYADTPLLLPPSARQFVLAAQLDLAHFHPRWQAAVMRLSMDPSMGLVARTIGGEQQELAASEVVSTPQGAMIVKFAPYLYGLHLPGDRQTVGRWIREAGTSDASLSPYLKEAAAVPDRVGTEIIMAIDLTDALSKERVEEAMSRSEVLQKNSIDHKAAADVLTSIRGLTLGARVTRRVHGVLKIDFERDATVLADVAKPLLLETLGNAGASIDEFADWNPKISGKRITLEGDLTQSGLRRLFSFLEIDATAVDAKESTASSDDALAPSVDAYTSLQYFQSIARHLNDLKHETGASSYYTIAVWFDKYARRIDRLPILHVDKDLVDYGKRTVGQLRNCVDAIRGAGISSGARSAQVTGAGYGYDGSGYAPYALYSSVSPSSRAEAQVGAVEQERRAIRAQEQGQSSMDVRAIIRQIEDDTSNVRRLMTERYNIEFEAVPKRSAAKKATAE